MTKKMHFTWKQIPKITLPKPYQPSVFVSLSVLVIVSTILWVSGKGFTAICVALIGLLITTLQCFTVTKVFLLNIFSKLQNIFSLILLYLLLPPIYFLGLTIPGVILKLMGKDPLYVNKSSRTYWIDVNRQPSKWVSWQFTKEDHINQSSNVPLFIFRTAGIILLLLFLDALLGGIMKSVTHHPQLDFISKGKANKSQLWASEYWDEMKSMELFGLRDYIPHRIWGEPSFTGKHINIDKDGIRDSYKSKKFLASTGKVLSIFFFGGSTMWGVGNNDHGTIPSAFAKISEEAGIPVKATNYGVRAYNSFQELIYFQFLMIRNERPDFVVFYDGYNDVKTTLFSLQEVKNNPLQPLPFALAVIKKNLHDPDNIWRSIRVNSFSRQIFAKYIFAKPFSWNQYAISLEDLKNSDLTIETLSKRVRTIHNHVIEVINALAAKRGIETAFFWQPISTTRTSSNVDEYDPIWLEGTGTKAVYQKTIEDLPNEVVNLAQAFDRSSDPLYIDGVHVNNKGSEIIASLMFQHLQTKMAQKLAIKLSSLNQKLETEEGGNNAHIGH